MTQYGYALLGLTAIVAALAAVLAFAVLRLGPPHDAPSGTGARAGQRRPSRLQRWADQGFQHHRRVVLTVAHRPDDQPVVRIDERITVLGNERHGGDHTARRVVLVHHARLVLGIEPTRDVHPGTDRNAESTQAAVVGVGVRRATRAVGSQ